MCPDQQTSSPQQSSTCYFTYIPSSTYSHFSIETPSTSPLSAYSPDACPDPQHPLLAYREPPLLDMSSPPGDASRLLQLQTSAAHRPQAHPLQRDSISSESSSSSASSDSAGSTPLALCCSRCRRTAFGTSGMIRIGTNLYYCSHCASMTGYNTG